VESLIELLIKKFHVKPPKSYEKWPDITKVDVCYESHRPPLN